VEKLEQLPDFSIVAKEKSLNLDFPKDWLKDHPLTAHALESEKVVLGKAGLKLSIS
jgi:exopolyphosphatase/guanosine-5'-triphosphate,3'-diphosphate pyrophosphatase